jgi:hypothetical protein
MEGQCISALSRSPPPFSVASERNLLTAEACLVAEYRTGAALAFQAMAHGDACWFAFNR